MKALCFHSFLFSEQSFLAPGIEAIMAARRNEWELSEEEGFVESCLETLLME